jgi:hypothetical protein
MGEQPPWVRSPVQPRILLRVPPELELGDELRAELEALLRALGYEGARIPEGPLSDLCDNNRCVDNSGHCGFNDCMFHRGPCQVHITPRCPPRAE